MSLAQRFERRLEGLVGGAFARVFKGQVEPVEIANALTREAGDKRNVMGSGQVFAPNRYRVTLGPTDYDRLAPWEQQLTNSLAEMVQEHLDNEGWTTIGDIEVYLVRDDNLHTGVFGVASRMESHAPPRQRPHDSLSIPIMPGRAANDYGAYEPAPAYAAQPAPPLAPSFPPPQQPFPGPPQPQFPPSPQYPPQPQYAAPPPGPYQPQPRPLGARIAVDGTNKTHELRVGSNTVGRGSDADLQLLDQGVSRRHLDVQFDGNFATAYDLGSTNGTTVNGRPIGSQLLRHGDVIKVGHTKLVYNQAGLAPNQAGQ